jgi:DNA-3-methyladenine glycosylase II
MTAVAASAPDFWDQACGHLAKRDRVMRKLIPSCGPSRLQCRGDAFTTLARSIIGQQISVKAAQTVWDRFVLLMPEGSKPLSPEGLMRLPTSDMRSAGLSVRKVEYLQELARHFAAGAVREADWSAMDDESVIRQLVEIRGIGRWTAEMFLIFNLLRPDVFPLDDLGLLKAIALQYNGGQAVSRSQAAQIGERWQPWRTVATWYLWRSLDPVPVAY